MGDWKKCVDICFVSMQAIALLFLVVATTHAQPFVQQGTKLLGSGFVLYPNRGYSVAMSQHGNAALISGPADNNSVGALWYFIRSNGIWSQYGSKILPPGPASLFGSCDALSFDATTAVANSLNMSPAVGAYILTRSGSVW